MKAPELAHACVTLDRFVFYQLQKSSALRDLYAWVKQQLRKYGGLLDFENLCEAGAEADELFWLLAGCKGLPGFTRTLEVFGWSPPQLRRGLRTIEKAVTVIENMQRHPFGLLARHADPVSASGLDKLLPEGNEATIILNELSSSLPGE